MCLITGEVQWLTGARKEAKATEARPVEPLSRPTVLDVGPEFTLA